MLRRLTAFLLLLLLATSCGPKEPALLILCGSSFRPPAEKLVEMYRGRTGTTVELSFAGSEDLLPVVKIGKEGDIFVTHDPYLDYTREAGALLEGVEVGSLSPVLVVSKTNPADVKTMEDLAKPGLKVALPDPKYSTCGEMLVRLLDKKGIRAAVEANADGAFFRSHGDTAKALQLGHRQAGVMWNGTAHTFLEHLTIVPTPYEYDMTVRVHVMGLSYTKRAEAVKTFLEFIRAEGPKVFAEFGYVK